MKLELVPGRWILRMLLDRLAEGVLARRELTFRMGRLVILSRRSSESLIIHSDEGSDPRTPRAVAGRAGCRRSVEGSSAKLLSHSADHWEGTVDRWEVIRLSERSGMGS